MKISNPLTDQAVLTELGGRLAQVRLALNLTQAALAEQAGVSKRTVERMESGVAAIQLSGFIRVCRVLGLLERLDALIPAAKVSPMEQLKLQGRKRQRASGDRGEQTAKAGQEKAANKAASNTWTWSDS